MEPLSYEEKMELFTQLNDPQCAGLYVTPEFLAHIQLDLMDHFDPDCEPDGLDIKGILLGVLVFIGRAEQLQGRPYKTGLREEDEYRYADHCDEDWDEDDSEDDEDEAAETETGN